MSAETITPSPEEAPHKKSLFFKKLERDVWEAWVWTALGLGVCAAIIWLVAYLKLGYTSVYAYGVGIPLTAIFAVPIILWGLLKTLFNPPVMRLSRSIGFFILFATAWFANSPMFIAPVSTAEWRSSHTYRLPFDGEWYTISGGLDRDTNLSVTSPALRFAYLFTRLTPEGARFSGDELELESYPCYGAPVLAPAAGTVRAVHKKQKDNVPCVKKDADDKKECKTSDQNMLGNHVVLEVAPEEYFIASFLKQNSVSLEVGAQVAAGDKIGECGNSGGSAAPQLLVYLVKDGGKLVLTEGLPMRFSNYELMPAQERVVEGIPLGSGKPEDMRAGQTVRPFTP